MPVAVLPLAAAAAVCFEGASHPADGSAKQPSAPPSALREIWAAQAG